jgi:hypothetical protein
MTTIHAVRAADPAYDAWRAAHAAWKALPPINKVKPPPGRGYDYFPARPTQEASYVDIAPGTLLHTYEFTWNVEMHAAARVWSLTDAT